MRNFHARQFSKKPDAALACSDAASNLKFEREDWTSFRTIDGLQQKAGVAKGKPGPAGAQRS
jgi:hypothetical protein